MRTRTTLTTRPGEAPTEDGTSGPPGEHWFPALAMPSEPVLPSRWRPMIITIVAVAIIGSALFGAWRITQRGTSFDPALNRDTNAAAAASVAWTNR